MTNREQSVIDDIDALVDEQMAGGEPIGGYDYNDPDYPKCPHCRRTWHGLAITQRIEGMAWRGVMDPDYRYADDDSPVLCPGSDFIGPVATPEQLYWIRSSEETKRSFPNGRIPSINEVLLAAMQGVPHPDLAQQLQVQRSSPYYILPGPSRNDLVARLWNREFAEPLWTLPDYPSDSAPYMQGPDVNDGDRVAFMSTNGFRYTGIARVEHHGTETVIHLDETEESRRRRDWTITVGADPAHPPPETPQERALPRPATRPPMWANDPARTRRGRNRARSIRTPRI